MKLLRWAFIVAAVGLYSACTTAPEYGLGKFHDEKSADVVVHYLNWTSISITKPDTSEGGYLPMYDKAGAEAKLRSLSTRRGLAVVTCAYTLGPDRETEAQQYWIKTFSDLGFRHITFVRANRDRSVDGCAIMKTVDLKTGAIQAAPLPTTSVP